MKWPIAVLAAALVMMVPPAAGAGMCTQEIADTWSEPITIGPTGAAWDPNDFAWTETDALSAITLQLSWENTPTDAADFGIAIGNSTGFRYWNQAFQTSLGAHSETLNLDADTLAEYGWIGASQLQVGPSISTGQFGATGIPYTLVVEATFEMPPCEDPAPPSTATPMDPAPPANPETPVRDAPDSNRETSLNLRTGFLAIAGVGAAIAIVVVLARRSA